MDNPITIPFDNFMELDVDDVQECPLQNVTKSSINDPNSSVCSPLKSLDGDPMEIDVVVKDLALSPLPIVNPDPLNAELTKLLKLESPSRTKVSVYLVLHSESDRNLTM